MTDSPEPPLTRLSDVLATARLDGDAGEAQLPPDWTQGRTIYGGLSVATCLAALREAQPALPALRSVLAQFVGPVAPGPVQLRRRELRVGTSVTQLSLELLQEGTPRVLVTAAYGDARKSRAVRAGGEPPECPAPEQATPMDHQPGLTPTFMRHLDYRIALGHPPITGAPTPTLGGWFRFRSPGKLHPDALVAMLVDAWPPPALSMLTRPRPASTVSWHLAPTPAMAAACGDAWFLIHTDAPQSGEGFTPVRAELWDHEGRMLAVSQQVDVVFG